jgi:hypothetical protein
MDLVGVRHVTPPVTLEFYEGERHDMNENENPALEKAADTINDAVEEIALRAADAAIEPDPEHVAGRSNEQLYLPEISQTVLPPNQSGHFRKPHSPKKEAAKEAKAKP